MERFNENRGRVSEPFESKPKGMLDRMVGSFRLLQLPDAAQAADAVYDRLGNYALIIGIFLLLGVALYFGQDVALEIVNRLMDKVGLTSHQDDVSWIDWITEYVERSVSVVRGDRPRN